MKPRETVVFDPAANSAMDRQFMLSQLVVLNLPLVPWEEHGAGADGR